MKGTDGIILHLEEMVKFRGQKIKSIKVGKNYIIILRRCDSAN